MILVAVRWPGELSDVVAVGVRDVDRNQRGPRRGARARRVAEGDPVPTWRPGGLAIRPALTATMGDLAETSAVYVDGIERFIAARCGWVELAPLEQKCRAGVCGFNGVSGPDR